jgi:pimeloyl-ACP methyl ester carboxylesterase
VTTTPLRPPGSRELHVDLVAGRLRVLAAGEPHQGGGSTPLLLLHGGGTDSAAISWYRLLAPLGRDRLVVAPDLPGFGGSIEVPPVGGPDALADTAVAVLDALGIARAVVGGVSMGGDVALHLALRHPERVAGLVLIAPGGLVDRVGGPVAHTAAWLATRLPDGILLPLARFANRFARSTMRSIAKDPTTLPAESVDEFVREARHPLGGVAYGRYNQATVTRHGMSNDVSDLVDGIAAPTLFVHGEDDRMVPIAGSRRAAVRMPRARLVAVADCGHWAQLEAHDLALAEITSFLDEVEKG